MTNVVSQASSATSPSSNKLGTSVEIPLNDTIPIIFIPGIMGSNIFNKALNKPVWRLGNGGGIVKTLAQQINKSPAVIQRELDPLNTEVDKNGTIKVDTRLKLNEKILRDRYWGTVHWDSYGEILTFLQVVLNAISLDESPLATYGGVMGGGTREQRYKPVEATLAWKSLLDQNEIKKWKPQQTLVAISQQDIEHLKNFNFPVYALGYNWLQSNEIGAATVAQKLNKIKQEYGARFHKFIVVSHSMGGLLTRRLIQLMGSDIAGVVHGVMPAEGAAAAYRRIVTGSEDVGALPAYVLGKNTEHVTAVLANAPGGLELLPTKAYNQGKPWLFLKGTGLINGNQIKNVVSLPESNPYEEIYKADNVWWEMVKDELIDPAGMVKKNYPGKRIKDVYFKKIDKVKEFHELITNNYHSCTYINYGHDPKHSSFGTISWQLSPVLAGLTAAQIKRLPRISAKEVEDYNKQVSENANAYGKDAAVYKVTNTINNNGFRFIRLKNGNLGIFKISGKDSDGDGTVPYQSGQAPLGNKGVKQVFQMNGFDHQGSFSNLQVKRSVLYSIVRIIKENNIQPKFR